jgi:hypothetical protein
MTSDEYKERSKHGNPSNGEDDSPTIHGGNLDGRLSRVPLYYCKLKELYDLTFVNESLEFDLKNDIMKEN